MKPGKLLLLFIFLCAATLLKAQNFGPPPRFLFFEYGPVGKSGLGTLSDKNNSHFAVGVKVHHWKEEKPFQFEADIDYRNVTFYDSLNARTSLGMGEMYVGPRLLISKYLPVYPTASALFGGYYIFGNNAGFNALLSVGIYYNFTQPGQSRNGLGVELTYRPVKVDYNSLSVPPAFALRVEFFF